MGKILGLDLGANSIGWAIINNSSNKTTDFGVNTLTISSDYERLLAKLNPKTDNRLMLKALNFYKEKLSRKANQIILILFSCLFITALLTFINISNWQFWLNLSLTVFVATLSLLYQDKQ